MEDKDINIKLAEAMDRSAEPGWVCYTCDRIIPASHVTFSEQHDECGSGVFWHDGLDYRSPEIFAENVKWLLLHDIEIRYDGSFYIFDHQYQNQGALIDESLEKAAALSRIKASEEPLNKGGGDD